MTLQEPLGLVTLDRWFSEFGYDYAVLLDGVDISYGCVWFNDETGEACCLKRDSNGQFYRNDCEDNFDEILHGVVRVVKL